MTVALSGRDRALAALDAGDAARAAGLIVEALRSACGDLDTAAVLVAAAEIEENLGDFAAARRHVDRAVALVDAAAVADLELWCQCHERLANLERLAGDFAGAEARLLHVLERVGGHDHQRASALNSLGVLYKYAGRWDDAAAAYARCLADLEAQGADPLLLAGLLHNLGGLAHARNRPTQGIPHAERGLALRTSGVGGDHPDTGRDLAALGALYEQAGRADDAEQAYRRALSLFETAYGPDHFEVGMVCGNLATLTLAHPSQSERYGRRSLAVLERVLGPGDAEVGLTLVNLAVAVAEQGRYADARPLAERGAGILAERLPEGHPHRSAAARLLAGWA